MKADISIPNSPQAPATVLAAMKEALRSPATRALLVTESNAGALQFQPIASGESVLDIQHELLSHLDAFPHSAEFLVMLRDYCEARLQARVEADLTGGLVISRGCGRFDIAHVPAYEPVEVA